MEISTTDSIPGREVARNYGLVFGASKLGSGGTSNVESAVEDAVTRMISGAQHAGADAIIGVTFRPMMSESADAYASVFVYGTAVRLESDAELGTAGYTRQYER